MNHVFLFQLHSKHLENTRTSKFDSGLCSVTILHQIPRLDILATYPLPSTSTWFTKQPVCVPWPFTRSFIDSEEITLILREPVLAAD